GGGTSRQNWKVQPRARREVPASPCSLMGSSPVSKTTRKPTPAEVKDAGQVSRAPERHSSGVETQHPPRTGYSPRCWRERLGGGASSAHHSATLPCVSDSPKPLAGKPPTRVVAAPPPVKLASAGLSVSPHANAVEVPARQACSHSTSVGRR